MINYSIDFLGPMMATINLNQHVDYGESHQSAKPDAPGGVRLAIIKGTAFFNVLVVIIVYEPSS